MNVTAHKLMDQQFDANYKQSVLDWDTENTSLLSLTFTLNPINNKADILSQYRMLMREIKSSKLFYYKDKLGINIHPDFVKMYIVPELTQQLVVHLHGIMIVIKGSENYFINEVRRLCWKNPILGRQHACKVVDNDIKSKDAIACYALKDLKEMNKVIDKDKIYKYSFESNIEK